MRRMILTVESISAYHKLYHQVSQTNQLPQTNLPCTERDLHLMFLANIVHEQKQDSYTIHNKGTDI